MNPVLEALKAIMDNLKIKGEQIELIINQQDVIGNKLRDIETKLNKEE